MAPAMTTPYIRDRQWFRTVDRTGVLAGSPLTQFTVTTAGARILDALESGGDLPAGHEPLTNRLLATGAIHPGAVSPVEPARITVVIPTRITTPEAGSRLRAMVDSLAPLQVIVVDDASPIEVMIPGARVIRHPENTGPGGARNTGLAAVRTPCVAFVDDDVTIAPGGLCTLAGHLGATGAALVAPRVRSRDTGSQVANYERHHSPLDMGAAPAVVRPTSRVSYVPSAVIVARVDTVRAAGGFTAPLRIGEDVDLVWRLVESGATVRYVPMVEAVHEPRPTFTGFIAQRFRYGTSAADLAKAHGGAATPLRTHAAMLIPLLLLAAGQFLAAAPATVLMYGWFIWSLRSTKVGLGDRVRIITIGARATVVHAVRAVARSWWPVFAVLAGFSSTVSTVLTVCVVAPAAIDVLIRRPRNPLAHAGLFVLDNFSYGAGVWAGAWRTRSLRCLVPAVVVSSRRLRSKG